MRRSRSTGAGVRAGVAPACVVRRDYLTLADFSFLIRPPSSNANRGQFDTPKCSLATGPDDYASLMGHPMELMILDLVDHSFGPPQQRTLSLRESYQSFSGDFIWASATKGSDDENRNRIVPRGFCGCSGDFATRRGTAHRNGSTAIFRLPTTREQSLPREFATGPTAPCPNARVATDPSGTPSTYASHFPSGDTRGWVWLPGSRTVAAAIP
jgi:hypothetical protein